MNTEDLKFIFMFTILITQFVSIFLANKNILSPYSFYWTWSAPLSIGIIALL